MELNFNAEGLIPVVAQDINTGEVLMHAYANREAVELTLTTRQAHYFSRSRQALWHKGATSGHVQHIEDVRYDCYGNTLLYVVRQEGAACHTYNYSCFYRSLLNTEAGKINAPAALHDVITSRKAQSTEGSYTNYLFKEGLDKILKKVGEEAAEVLIAAKNGGTAELAAETADLMYHITVLLVEMGMGWDAVWKVLRNRVK
jgi:phosphoribosyl-ATP pyrophosphohydrolase/phosphoribosyl-AMP cyclohydrolase